MKEGRGEVLLVLYYKTQTKEVGTLGLNPQTFTKNLQTTVKYKLKVNDDGN
jgi:hypothetical protein